jgi:hypothetical protein
MPFGFLKKGNFGKENVAPIEKSATTSWGV